MGMTHKLLSPSSRGTEEGYVGVSSQQDRICTEQASRRDCMSRRSSGLVAPRENS